MPRSRQPRQPRWWTHLLFRGQRRAQGSHDCMHCGREIGSGEYYWTRVTLWRDEDGFKHIAQTKSCCKAV